MLNWIKNRPVWTLTIGLTLGALVGAGAMLSQSLGDRATLALPETLLNASGADSCDEFAIATGAVDSDAEGLFTLDFLTGDLQCSVIYVKNGVNKFGGAFRTNILNDLGLEKSKQPKYLMVTGLASFVRGGGNTRPGMSVCYVLDANTGNFAAYGVPWNPQDAARTQPQQGKLVLLDKGMARQQPIRGE